jgi:hypothetical protein
VPLKPPGGKPAPKPLSQQITLLLQGLEGVRSNKADPRYTKVVDWLRDFPVHARPDGVFEAVGRAFGVSADTVKRDVDPKANQTDFESLVPKKGWLRDYIEYTRFTEPPTVFHFFVGCTVLGSAMRRNIHYVKGTGNLFPNLCVILVAPSGKCKKTTACELGVKLLRDIGHTILADKVTPEALVDAFQERTEATGLLYAGELKQFLGSQKYMEGMIPLLTRLFDSPDQWSSRTIARQELTLTNVGLTMLGASTMDWLRMLPPDSFGGGFMSRLLLVVQEDTPRCFPFPPPLSDTLRVRLLNRMIELSRIRGQVLLTPNAQDWYAHWYKTREGIGHDDKQFSGYFERKPDHLIRLGMILSAAEGGDVFVLEQRHLEHSLRILDWTESWLPGAFESLGATPLGEETARMISQLKKAGGTLKHSDWLRKNSSRMSATQFKQHVQTMREAKLIDMEGASYYLTAEGWKR